jgi:hypothetical protein
MHLSKGSNHSLLKTRFSLSRLNLNGSRDSLFTPVLRQNSIRAENGPVLSHHCVNLVENCSQQ